MGLARTVVPVVAAAVVGGSAYATWAAAPLERPAVRRVVVAELFTSEGCSSCPPADAALPQLAASARSLGIEVIALEEHVDYWDDLGWKDPFSSSAFSRRQSEYASRVFRSADIYTPQLVVDGAAQCIGSDRDAAMAAITRAAAVPGVEVRIEGAEVRGRAVETDVLIPDGRRAPADTPLQVVLAVIEDGLVSQVGAGENTGRRLEHTGVVRSLAPAGEVRSGRAPARLRASIPLGGVERIDRARLVAFLQAPSTRQILGAAVVPLARGAGGSPSARALARRVADPADSF